MCGSRARGRVGAGGGARGRGLSPGQGTFSETSSPPGPRGTCPRPWTRAGVSKVALGARDGLGATRISWFSPPVARPSGSPAPSRGFKPPARTPVHAARRGPRAAAEEVQLSPRAGGRASGSTWPRDDLAGRAAAAARSRGGGRFPDPAGSGRPSSRGREGRLANFAELSPFADRSRLPARTAPAPPAEGRRGSPSAPSPPAGRRLPRCRGSPRGFAPFGRRGCCLPGRWVALCSGWSLSCRLSLTSQLEFLLTCQGPKELSKIGGWN